METFCFKDLEQLKLLKKKCIEFIYKINLFGQLITIVS